MEKQMKDSFEKKLATYFDAYVPIVYIVTSEELKAEEAINKI